MVRKLLDNRQEVHATDCERDLNREVMIWTLTTLS